MTLYIIETCGTVIAPPVAKEVSRTPALSRMEMVTASSEKSAVTRRPRSAGDRPFGVRTSMTIRRILPSAARSNTVWRRRTNGHRSTPSVTSRVGERGDALDGDGVVAEHGHEAVLLGGRRRCCRRGRGAGGATALHRMAFEE